MNINLQLPKVMDLRPRLTVVGVGGAGGNAVNNMIASGLGGVEFIVANTDAQSLAASSAEHRIQLGVNLTEGLGAGARPEIGQAAAEEALDEIRNHVAGSHMVFIAAGMGGGTGTGAAAVIARIARECGALTVAVVTKPFQFEGSRRMRAAEAGVAALRPNVDTMIVIPNQNLFRVANEKTTFAEAFVMADQVLYSGIACIVDLIVKEGLINLDFADVRTIMSGMGSAMMGTGEASGERRAVLAAEEAISNPLLDDISLRGARGLLLSITGGRDLTLYEVDEAATRVRQEVDSEANIIVGATFDDALGDRIRVSIVASGMERIGELPVPAHSPAVAAQQMTMQHRPAESSRPPEPVAAPSPVETYAASAAANVPSATPPGHAFPQAHAQQQLAPSPRYAAHQMPMPMPSSEPSAPQSAAHGDAAPSLRPQWSSATGATFEESAPVLGASPTPAPSFEPQFDSQQSDTQGRFVAEPPAEQPRSGRRLPEVDDFPAVGQREYRAKSAQYADPGRAGAPRAPRAPTPPQRAPSPSTPEPPRKLGFFERLTGAKRKPAAPPPANVHPQARRGSGSEPPAAAPATRHTAADNPQRGHAAPDESAELPVFFGGERKSR